MVFFYLLVKIEISGHVSYKTRFGTGASESHVTVTCSINFLFFPMWIEQILEVLFVAKAVDSFAFVSVSFFPNACMFHPLAEPGNLLNVSMMNS